MMGWLLYREPERNPLPPGSIGNAEIHVIIVVDGGGKRAFFFFSRAFCGITKLKDFLTLSSLRLSQRRKL